MRRDEVLLALTIALLPITENPKSAVAEASTTLALLEGKLGHKIGDESDVQFETPHTRPRK